jgi:hypothetical protein
MTQNITVRVFAVVSATKLVVTLTHFIYVIVAAARKTRALLMRLTCLLKQGGRPGLKAKRT